MLCTHQKTAILRMVDPQLLYSHCCGHQNIQVARNQSIDITINRKQFEYWSDVYQLSSDKSAQRQIPMILGKSTRTDSYAQGTWIGEARSNIARDLARTTRGRVSRRKFSRPKKQKHWWCLMINQRNLWYSIKWYISLIIYIEYPLHCFYILLYHSIKKM